MAETLTGATEAGEGDARVRTAEAWPLIGGAACLDFVNTLGSRVRADGHEVLTSYAAVVAWAEHAGVLAADERAGLLALARRDPAAARAAVADLVDLREAIYRLARALADGDATGATEAYSAAYSDDDRRRDLAILGASVARAAANRRLRPAPDGAGATWDWAGLALDRVAWPLALAAADLLTAEQGASVRQCPGCGWLFVDATKNHSRRYCSPRWCGNRIRVRRFAARHHERAPEGA